MLTPIDIRNKEFSRSFRGYNEDEIDEFLDQVITDYEKLYRENKRYEDELALNKKNLEQYHRMEKNLQDTLLVAQKTAEEVVSAAKKNAEDIKVNAMAECENMRKDTDVKCKKQLDEAKESVRVIVAEYERLVNEKHKFIRRVKSMMQAELSLLEESEAAMPDRVNSDVKEEQVKEEQLQEAEQQEDN